MASILVTYGTGQGQTARVAEYIDSVLADRGHDVTTLPVGEASGVELAAFDAVLVGSPVNNRRHLPPVLAFVERHRDGLETRPSGFFQLSLAALVPSRWAGDVDHEYVDAMVERTGWAPEHVGCFAGAITYTQYDWPMRWVFQLVSMLTTGDTDTSRDYEYTDWSAVEDFAVAFAEAVEAETGRGRGVGRRLSRVAVGAAAVALAAGGVWIARQRRGARSLAEDPSGDEAPEPIPA